jgi:hypothetical protein
MVGGNPQLGERFEQRNQVEKIWNLFGEQWVIRSHLLCARHFSWQCMGDGV